MNRAVGAATLETATVPMAVVQHGQRIAFAAYDEEANKITIQECIATGYEAHDAAERVVAVVRPTLLLLSNKMVGDSALLNALRAPPPNPSEGLSGEDNEEEQDMQAASMADSAVLPRFIFAVQQNSTPYRIMKTSTFDVRTCKANILQLKVGSLMRKANQNNGPLQNGPPLDFPMDLSNSQVFSVSSFHSLASIVDFDSVAQVQAVGALLSFLQTTVFQMEEMFVNDIVRAKASLHMIVSAETLSALHIFATEHHPLGAAKGKGNAKEGFSLFSMLDRTASRAGRQRLREWMLKPLMDIQAIEARQDGVELFMQPEMLEPARRICEFLEGIGAVDKVLVRIQKCIVKPNDFLVVAKSLSGAVAVFATLQEEIISLKKRIIPDPSQIVDPLQFTFWQEDPQAERYLSFVANVLERCHVPTMQTLLARVTKMIDEESTFDSKKLVIRPGYHTRLDSLKQEYDELGRKLDPQEHEKLSSTFAPLTEAPILFLFRAEVLAQEAEKLIESTPSLKDVLTVVFVPQVGFLISLKNTMDWHAEGAVPDEYDFVFTEAGCSFFKHEDMLQMDAEIGDLDASIKDTEAMILAELEDVILDCNSELLDTFDAMADLDCILAFADCAKEKNYVRPEVVPAEENCIQILNGRHPLSELKVEKDFIPNDTNIHDSNRVNVITGPNFSGKSCYVRQVGIMSFMAQLGCSLPCDAAKISVMDQILARFSSTETCAVPQSSFQLDLTQMGSILRRASPHSLVIIDEFGKGTSPASGIALLTAALRHFSQSSKCKVLCTTHFLEIFSMGLIRDGENGIKALRMGVYVPITSQEDPSPLFLLEEGVASSSAGLVCAKLAGVNQTVIARSEVVVDAIKNRNKVEPLAEILCRNLNFSDIAKDALDSLIHTDWETSCDEDIAEFMSRLAF